jgi:tetratricopeptide (TPR) repeat protein
MKMSPLAAVLLLLPPAGRAETVSSPADMVRQAATAYREGRLTEALRGSARVLETDPENAAAKNLIWTIAQDARKRRYDNDLRPGEKARADALARRYLNGRREKTERAIEELKRVEERSQDLRSPTGLLSALGGLDQTLQGESADRFGERAQVHFSTILRNLEEALDKQVFAGRKDHLRAQGYLAYYNQDWERAADLWEKALREDPDDAQIRNDLSSLKTLLRRKRDQAELKDLLNQAETYFEAGLYAQAMDAWQGVLKLDPKYPGAVESLSACRVARDKAERHKRLKGMMEEASAENRAGRPLRAAEICLQALQVDPTYSPARSLLKLAGARLSLAEASPRAPAPPTQGAAVPPAPPVPGGQGEKAEALYKRGLLQYSDGDVSGAVGSWRETLALDPSHKKAREALRQGESELLILQK